MPTKQGTSPKLKRANKTPKKGAVREHTRKRPDLSGAALHASDPNVGCAQRAYRQAWEKKQVTVERRGDFFSSQAVLAADDPYIVELSGTAQVAALRFLTKYGIDEVSKTNERGVKQKRCQVIAERTRLSFPEMQRRFERKAIDKGIRTAIRAVTDAFEQAKELAHAS